MLDKFKINFQLTPADEKIIDQLRPHTGYLSTFDQGIGKDLVDAIIAFHLLKYRTENYEIGILEADASDDASGLYRLIKESDQLLQPTTLLFHEKYNLMTRAVSFALAALLFNQYSQQEKSAADFSDKVFVLTQAFIERVNAIEELPDGSIGDAEYKKLRKEFSGYLRQLASLLPVKAGLAQKYKALTKAEQYVNWELPRPSYATVYQIDGIQTLQRSESKVLSLSESQRQEFAAITKPEANKPFWFARLAVWEQNYLQDKVVNHQDSFNNAKSAAERTLPGNSNAVANYFYVGDVFELASYSHTVPSPIGIRSKKLAENDQAPAVLERERLAQQNLEQALSVAGISIENNAVSISENRKQEFLARWGLTEDKIPEGTVLTLPIIERGLLSPLTKSAVGFVDRFNYANNNSAMLTEKQVALTAIKHKIEQNQLPTDKIVPAIYQPNYPINGIRGVVAQVSTDQAAIEATQFLHNVFALLKQITEIKGLDETLHQQLAELEQDFTYANNNLPVNQYRQKKIEQIVGVISNLDLSNLVPGENKYHQRMALLKAALIDYIKLHHLSDHNDNNKQLFLASLESIINNMVGGVDIMHCKSAKDRRALVANNTLAMVTYFTQHQELPSYQATEESDKRKAFVNIYAKVYRAFHEAEQAGLNSRGSAGIIKEALSLQDTLPKDIQRAIGRVLTVSQRAASLNKPKLKQPIPWLVISSATALLTALAVVSMIFLTPVIGPAAVIIIGAVLGSLFGAAAGFLTPGPSWKKCLVGSLVGLLAFAPFLAPVAPAILASLGIGGVLAAKILAVTGAITAGLQSVLAPVHIGLLTVAASLSAGLAHWYNTKRTLFAKGDFAASKAKPDLLTHEKHERLFAGGSLEDKPPTQLNELESKQARLWGWVPSFFKAKKSEQSSLLSASPSWSKNDSNSGENH